jgi:uncharacterized RDD family membrane protein YckC
MPGTEQDTLRVTTADNVGIGYRVAGLATRLIAAVIDTAVVLVILLLAYLLIVAIATVGGGGPSSTFGALILLGAVEFFILVFYFTIAEAVSGGRTPGKRAMGIRVISIEGGTPNFGECFLRNLAFMVDVPFFIGPVLMFFHPEGRRVGDILAGTVVAGDRPAVSLAEVMAPPPVYLRSPDPGPPLPGVSRLGEREFSAVRTLLSRPGLRPEQRARLAALLAARLYERMEVPPAAPERALPPEALLERIYLQRAAELGP